jgi:hypothetical protein
MKKGKFILAGAIALMSFSSCGIFKKGCGCPHFGKIKAHEVQMCTRAGVQMMA